MLKKVKSAFISKIIFNSLNYKRKLEFFKYNKRLQKQTDLSLINYQYYTGKYIIYETPTKGKEYNGYNDELIYEGEYLNGKKNGKGKEYGRYGEIIFKGYYLNGKRNGPGKEYDSEQFIFEGNYLNGERNGKGKEYKNGELKFEGEYLNGKRNGKGKEYKKGYLIFKGNYLNGEKHGIFKSYYDGKKFTYEEYIHGKKIEERGKFYEENASLIFKGEYLNGEKWKGEGFYNKENIRYVLLDKKVKEYKKFDTEKIYYNFYENNYYDNDNNYHLIFEGEYLNGVRWKGKGEEYDGDKLL